MRIFTEEPEDKTPTLAGKIISAFSTLLLTKYKPADHRNQQPINVQPITTNLFNDSSLPIPHSDSSQH